jgi:hypothetical protein
MAMFFSFERITIYEDQKGILKKFPGNSKCPLKNWHHPIFYLIISQNAGYGAFSDISLR